ncbi:hypothetical protein BCR34DRAFT_314417 [Clohesyomyces aquaticus]|uniref:Uncharacterized protein n=1 Tax=Clohesyomyces aquaticus TaxID=1231657 RepID=A0A1Y1ZNN3_9PLEO|nr:hypothetical protein BCR34DRAFT_314417 [Clohesyomyces aquaticus]
MVEDWSQPRVPGGGPCKGWSLLFASCVFDDDRTQRPRVCHLLWKYGFRRWCLVWPMRFMEDRSTSCPPTTRQPGVEASTLILVHLEVHQLEFVYPSNYLTSRMGTIEIYQLGSIGILIRGTTTLHATLETKQNPSLATPNQPLTFHAFLPRDPSSGANAYLHTHYIPPTSLRHRSTPPRGQQIQTDLGSMQEDINTV